MIITLQGLVTDIEADHAVIETGGVGYQLFADKGTLAGLRKGESARLWTYEHVKDDGRELFGFPDKRARSLFMRMISVSGVGPRTALSLMSLGASSEIERRIDAADVDWLCSVPGIGKKTAQKIVLELKGKLVAEGASEHEEVIAALVGLGYSREVARDAVSAMPFATHEPVEERLRSVLRRLAGEKVRER